MRLIDVDLLIKGRVENDSVVIAAKCAPTAYDLDKVMEQLEEKMQLAYRRYTDCPSYSPCFERYRTQYAERKMCLEIVKGGGADAV